MKRSADVAIIAIAAWGWAMGACGTAIASQSEASHQANKPVPGDQSRLQQRAARSQRNNPARQVHTRLRKLQEAMKNKLGLDADQTLAINSIFQEYFDVLRDSERGRSAADSTTETSERMRVLQKQVLEARRAKDRDKIRELRREMQELLRAKRVSREKDTGAFLEKLGGELTDAQKPQFQMLLKRLRLDPERASRERSVANLVRLVMDPELNLSPEQRKDIHGIISETFAAKSRDPGDMASMEKAAELIRKLVMEKLTDDQRAILEKKLKEEGDY